MKFSLFTFLIFLLSACADVTEIRFPIEGAPAIYLSPNQCDRAFVGMCTMEGRPVVCTATDPVSGQTFEVEGGNPCGGDQLLRKKACEAGMRVDRVVNLSVDCVDLDVGF